MTLKEKYVEAHADWLDHYIEGNYRNRFLAFKQSFMEAEMPKKTGYGVDEVTVTVVDTEDDNKEYQFGWWLDFQENDHSHLFDKDWNEVRNFWTLFPYIYQEKLCPCNIKASAARAGAQVEDDECDGNRFQIKSITFDDHPDLILYSETLDEEQLENILAGKVNDST